MQDPHSHIVEIRALWERIRPGAGLLPGRKQFDPLTVPHLLPNIWLADVIPGARRRYRMRLVGGNITKAGFVGRQGDMIDESIAPDAAALCRLLDRVVETGEPDWRRGPPAVKHSNYVDTLERIVLPLATDGRTVDMLLGLVVFYWSSGEMWT